MLLKDSFLRKTTQDKPGNLGGMNKRTPSPIKDNNNKKTFFTVNIYLDVNI